jgi:transglutaminase-like putative cysteine protease
MNNRTKLSTINKIGYIILVAVVISGTNLLYYSEVDKQAQALTIPAQKDLETIIIENAVPLAPSSAPAQGILSPTFTDDNFESSSWQNPVTGELVTANVAYTYAEKGLVYIDVQGANVDNVLIALCDRSIMEGASNYNLGDSNKRYVSPGFYPMEKSGEYVLTIMMKDGDTNLQGEETYFCLYQKEFTASFEESEPARYATVYTNYHSESYIARKAIDVTKGIDTDIKKVSALARFVYENIYYDQNRADDITSNEAYEYDPDKLGNLDMIFQSGKGVCSEKAEVFAGMCKSIGIPCREVRGNCSNRYHSWNQVYIHGGWIDMDPSNPINMVSANGLEYVRTTVAY